MSNSSKKDADLLLYSVSCSLMVNSMSLGFGRVDQTKQFKDIAFRSAKLRSLILKLTNHPLYVFSRMLDFMSYHRWEGRAAPF